VPAAISLDGVHVDPVVELVVDDHEAGCYRRSQVAAQSQGPPLAELARTAAFEDVCDQ